MQCLFKSLLNRKMVNTNMFKHIMKEGTSALPVANDSSIHTFCKIMKNCTKRNCPSSVHFLACIKRYATSAALTNHKLTQSRWKVKCSVCNFTTSTRQYLNQHMTGTHGRRLQSRCGIFFSWPHQHQEHQYSCKKCKKISKKFKVSYLRVYILHMFVFYTGVCFLLKTVQHKAHNNFVFIILEYPLPVSFYELTTVVTECLPV